MAILYKGFTTVNRFKKFRLTDINLVKQDLINHFQIKKGEKLMQPNFGTIIWGMLFEPMTDAVRQAIIDDVKTIVGYDPRTNLQNIAINEFEHGILITVDLLYIPTNQVTSLALQFDAQAQTLSAQ